MFKKLSAIAIHYLWALDDVVEKANEINDQSLDLLKRTTLISTL
jgi:hypothetical protein